MSSSCEAECHPYAMLDRCQSRRVSSVPIGDNLQILMARKTEAPPYEDLINFPRAKDKDEIRCVMCGFPPGMSCAIPRQNKDVCKECDKSTWVHSVSNVYFKWCKGCKKFLRLGCFSEKLDAAKCDRCRERGRQSYLLKKGKDGSSRSRSNSVTSMKSDFENELSELSVAAAMASCGSRAAVSHSETSSGEEAGSDGEYDYPLEYMSPRDQMGDYNDTLMSAHAVVSFANFHDRRTKSPQDIEPVLIDDTGADVTKSKLSSVFGKPLRELKRMSSPSKIISEPCDNCGGDELENDFSESTVPVCTKLRGTLYELACIHERIMTLEEHASRVKCLEATIKEQQVEIDALRSDATLLRGELTKSRDQRTASPSEKVSLDGKRDVSNLAMILDDSVALEALTSAMERVQKRPRLVSMGE